MKTSTLLATAVTAICLVISAPAMSREKLPETTKDGLQLQKKSKLAAVYLKPGASLTAYDKIAITDVLVSFKKNWQRDYNQSVMRPDMRVSDDDVKEMQDKIAKEFTAVFTKELEKGGYSITEYVGQDVMVIRPALINIEVADPKPDKAAFAGATIVRDAGSLTLYAELYDSVSNEKFAEVLDTQEAGDDGFAHRVTSVSNKADLDSTLRHWAELLVKRLDEAHGK